jgi:hypothetical protein
MPARIKGYQAGEIIGQHFSRFYTEEDRGSGALSVALIGFAKITREVTERAQMAHDFNNIPEINQRGTR